MAVLVPVTGHRRKSRAFVRRRHHPAVLLPLILAALVALQVA